MPWLPWFAPVQAQRELSDWNEFSFFFSYPYFLIYFLDTDQIKQPGFFPFMRPFKSKMEYMQNREKKWWRHKNPSKIGLDRNVTIQVNLERFVWGHRGKTVLISSRQFALTGLSLASKHLSYWSWICKPIPWFLKFEYLWRHNSLFYWLIQMVNSRCNLLPVPS